MCLFNDPKNNEKDKGQSMNGKEVAKSFANKAYLAELEGLFEWAKKEIETLDHLGQLHTAFEKELRGRILKIEEM